MTTPNEAEDLHALTMRLGNEAEAMFRRIALHIQEDSEAEKHYTPTLTRLAKKWAASNPELMQADPVKQTTEKDILENPLYAIAAHIKKDPRVAKIYPKAMANAAHRLNQRLDQQQGQEAPPLVEITDTKQPIKTRQINIRLTAEQDRLLKQHCNRTGMTTQAAIIDALRRVIEGFCSVEKLFWIDRGV